MKRIERFLRRCWCPFIATLALAVVLTPGGAVGQGTDCADVKIGGKLPLPCSMPLADYEQVLYEWLNGREYIKLGWAKDKAVRDTGPYVLGANYGTHPAVRIYYSPEVIAWLKKGRRGELPDGAMIVKEMFDPPAARYEELRSTQFKGKPAAYERMLQENLGSWTIMIRDGQTWDGWFWAGPDAVTRRGKTPAEVQHEISNTLATNAAPFTYRTSDHGLSSCMRCHASAANAFTFASTDNIEGFPGEPLRFRVDNSWRTSLPEVQRPAAGEDETELFQGPYHGNARVRAGTIVNSALPAPNPEFARFFKLAGSPVERNAVRAFPGQWADHVTAGPKGADHFITSDNCMACHGGLGGAPSGVTMFLQTGPDYGDGYNVSQFGEWRWSPMGLAGRDPIFYAQLESEMALLAGDLPDAPDKAKALQQAVTNTCLLCHGAMGERQLLIDIANGAKLDPDFSTDYLYLTQALTKEQRMQPNYEYHKYGNLAREGISCMVCHRIDPPTEWKPGMPEDEKLEIYLMNSNTGIFPYSPAEELNGPYADVKVKPMEHALGITPKRNPYIQDSKMCGTCHTINLPNVDGKKHTFPVLDKSAQILADKLGREYGVKWPQLLTEFPHLIEQATFLEWQNSAFGAPGKDFQSCQACHMPGGFKSLDGVVNVGQIETQIATIQDSTYPEAEHELPRQDIEIPVRSDYRRHEMVGLNAFLLEMFEQFDDILGVAQTDYMTSAANGNALAIENMVRQAREQTVDLHVDVKRLTGNKLTATVTVTNKVGHRFPSGVGFRRAWLEFLVLDETRGGEVVWGSGRTNSVGVIVDGDGNPLPTEWFEKNQWQPHYDGRSRDHPAVTSQSEVQIYEEIVLNGEGEVTTSFIHRNEHPKDNRLLPRGWKSGDEFKSEVLRQFMAATDPHGAGDDPDYRSVPGFAGKDTVRYQIDLPKGVDSSNLSIRVTMNYQAIPPFWLRQRFKLSPSGAATQRLYYLTSHLNTKGTVIEDWKLPLVTVTAKVTP